MEVVGVEPTSLALLIKVSTCLGLFVNLIPGTNQNLVLDGVLFLLYRLVQSSVTPAFLPDYPRWYTCI